MGLENARASLDAAAHGVSLTAKADQAAEKLHMPEAEVTQHVSGTVEV